MSKYFRLLLRITLIIVTIFAVAKVSAQPSFIPDAPIPITETHNYSYFIDKDGAADVWIRVDQINIPEGEYSLQLPEGSDKQVKVWYRESNEGCVYPLEDNTNQSTKTLLPDVEVRQDQMYPCKAEIPKWNELKVERSGDNISVNIPKLKTLKNQKERMISLGATWKMVNITSKKWWGREVKITTAGSSNYVAYEQVAVDLPAGIYQREKKAKGPVNWNDMMADTRAMSQPQSGIDINQPFRPDMFDLVGSGSVIKTKDNIAPGKNYSFVLLTSTAIWKLYLKEIGIMLAGVLVLILVSSLLLRLVVGRKPFGWYVAVMLLVIILVGIIIWMVTLYKSLFFGYPPSIPVDYPAGNLENY